MLNPARFVETQGEPVEVRRQYVSAAPRGSMVS